MKSSVALRFFMVLIFLWPCCKKLQAQTTSSCDEIKVSVETVATSEGKSDGKIKLKFSEDASSYRIHLFEATSGSSYKLNVNKTEIESLRKGTYLLVITGKTENSRFCPKNIEVNVK